MLLLAALLTASAPAHPAPRDVVPVEADDGGEKRKKKKGDDQEEECRPRVRFDVLSP